MSILPGTMIDLHEYEHELIRGLLEGNILRPPPMAPDIRNFDPVEAAMIELNFRKADDLYGTFKQAEQKLGLRVS